MQGSCQRTTPVQNANPTIPNSWRLFTPSDQPSDGMAMKEKQMVRPARKWVQRRIWLQFFTTPLLPSSSTGPTQEQPIGAGEAVGSRCYCEPMHALIPDLMPLADKLTPGIVELRRDLHANPEIGLQLPATQRRITNALAGLGLDIHLGEALTSVVADLDTGRPGPTVLLRGDMDALPLTEESGVEFASTIEGRMHACGHDTHVAMLVGAARLLSELRSELTGRVRFMFQPGEEGHHGARLMIEEGLLEGVDKAFAIHAETNLPAGFVASRAGPMAAASDELHITVSGKGGHASAPHNAVDPIPAAASIVTTLQTAITQDIDAFDPAVVTIARIESGTIGNVIPETAYLEGTIRAISEASRTRVHDSIRRVAEAMAAAYECTAEVDIVLGYPVTINDGEVIDLAQRAIAALAADDHYVEMPAPIMGSEDFSYVLQQVPGAMVGLGMSPAEFDDPRQAPSLHSNRARFNEDALPMGIALHAAMAIGFAG